MSKTQHHWFYDELLLFNFRLVWPCDKTSLEKYVHDEFDDREFELPDDTWGGKALICFSEDGNKTFIVALRKWHGNADCHSVLVHECAHAARMILQARNVDMNADNDEMIAYLSAYLARKCLNVLLPKRLRVEVDPQVKPKKRR